MRVRRLGAEEWRLARSVRLQALQDAPAAFASSFDDEVVRPQQWWIDGMARLAWFVAEVDGAVVGVVAGLPGPDGPEVISMWVHPDHRGSGVADNLVAEVVGWARGEGAASVCLAVADDNVRARRFYERAGFEVRGPGAPLRSRPEACTVEMLLVLDGAAGTTGA